MIRKGMGPCVAIVGGTNRTVFEAYVEQLLSPGLEPGKWWSGTTSQPTGASG